MTARPILAHAALVVLAACGAANPPPRPVGAAPTSAPADRLVAAIEAEGCLLTAANVGAVLLRANLTQAELGPLTEQLQAQGRIEAPTGDTLRIMSPNCI